jgi:rod shape determining protein RodA
MTIFKNILDQIFQLNWILILLMVMLSIFGFVVLYSAALGSFDPWASKQIFRFVLLFPVMLLIALLPLKIWYQLSYLSYAIIVILLLATEFFGVTAMGATRWIDIGFINLQPSELTKVCIVFALARYFSCVSVVNVGRISYLIPPLIMVILPVGLVLKQPDLGTAFIIFAVAGFVFFAAGVRYWKFAVVALLGVCSLPLMWNFGMHDYQKMRVTTFLNPESDPMGAGYNILQSKIAIGSGGFLGKGFLNGSQSQLSFLPEKQTDFIFTMLTEEFGFVGGVMVIITYSLIILYGCFIAAACKNQFGKLIASGVTSIIFWHVFVNIAMVMGLIPVVGAPLPLLSYGGTIMMTMIIAFGILLNVSLYSEENMSRKI